MCLPSGVIVKSRLCGSDVNAAAPVGENGKPRDASPTRTHREPDGRANRGTQPRSRLQSAGRDDAKRGWLGVGGSATAAAVGGTRLAASVITNSATDMSPIRWRRSFARQRWIKYPDVQGNVCRQRVPVRLALQHARQRVGEVLALERTPPRQHLVEDGAKRPHVAPLVRGAALRLFRAHVRRGAQNHTCQRRRGHRQCGRLRQGSRAGSARFRRHKLSRDRSPAPSRCRLRGP